jgi:predicted nucleotide-binding protein
MKKAKWWYGTRFAPEVIEQALALCDAQPIVAGAPGETLDIKRLTIQRGREYWEYDSSERYFRAYREGFDFAKIVRFYRSKDIMFAVDIDRNKTDVSVEALDEVLIDKLLGVFEAQATSSRIAVDRPPLTVFIGHGRNDQWRDLKDHLHEKHGYGVTAYEIGSRAGHAIRDILEDMLRDSSFAILVLTGEDQTRDGALRARQNVVHEIGVFQGRLGFGRVLLLCEKKVELFTNIAGLQYVLFKRGQIRSTFGDVLAALHDHISNETQKQRKSSPP